MGRPEQMRSVEQMCSSVAMAIHTRLNELRFLSKTSKLYYEQSYTQGSMLSLQAVSNAHFVQLVGGLGRPQSEVHITQLVRRLVRGLIFEAS